MMNKRKPEEDLDSKGVKKLKSETSLRESNLTQPKVINKEKEQDDSLYHLKSLETTVKRVCQEMLLLTKEKVALTQSKKSLNEELNQYLQKLKTEQERTSNLLLEVKKAGEKILSLQTANIALSTTLNREKENFLLDKEKMIREFNSKIAVDHQQKSKEIESLTKQLFDCKEHNLHLQKELTRKDYILSTRDDYSNQYRSSRHPSPPRYKREYR